MSSYGTCWESAPTTSWSTEKCTSFTTSYQTAPVTYPTTSWSTERNTTFTTSYSTRPNRQTSVRNLVTTTSWHTVTHENEPLFLQDPKPMRGLNNRKREQTHVTRQALAGLGIEVGTTVVTKDGRISGRVTSISGDIVNVNERGISYPVALKNLKLCQAKIDEWDEPDPKVGRPATRKEEKGQCVIEPRQHGKTFRSKVRWLTRTILLGDKA